jgi:lysophospholipase L1-like esterase
MTKKLKVTLALLALAAVASLALNVTFFRMGSNYFRELNAVRLDPLGLQVHATNIPPPPAAGERRVVFFGDSRALMWATPADAQTFQFVNRGVGQQTTAQILARFPHEIPQLHPTVVVLELGVNDLKTIALFPDRRDEITRTAQRNIRELVDRTSSLGAHVVLVTVFPLGPVPLTRRPFWSDDVAVAIAQVNAFIESLATDRVTVLRANEVLLDDHGELPDAFALDMLHLSDAAYRTLNQKKLLPLLRAIR